MNLPPSLVAAIFEAARGDYQRALLRGERLWSGARDGKYGPEYRKSRAALLGRIQALMPARWRASVEYVLAGDPRRWKAELLLNISRRWVGWEQRVQDDLREGAKVRLKALSTEAFNLPEEGT